MNKKTNKRRKIGDWEFQKKQLKCRRQLFYVRTAFFTNRGNPVQYNENTKKSFNSKKS